MTTIFVVHPQLSKKNRTPPQDIHRMPGSLDDVCAETTTWAGHGLRDRSGRHRRAAVHQAQRSAGGTAGRRSPMLIQMVRGAIKRERQELSAGDRRAVER